MRVRSVNEKAVSKLIAYLTELQKDLNDGIYVTGTHLQTKHQVSKSTYSVCKKLSIITEDQKWNQSFVSDRKTAIKILEYLRQQSDKQSDKPISDLWIAEINSIKSLLSEIRSNTKDRATGLKSASISERVYLAGQIFPLIYHSRITWPKEGVAKETLEYTDELLKQLNQ